MMNADASPGVALHGDLGAKFPPLPWLAAGLLLHDGFERANGLAVLRREEAVGAGQERDIIPVPGLADAVDHAPQLGERVLHPLVGQQAAVDRTSA